jgi:hypothetical protein
MHLPVANGDAPVHAGGKVDIVRRHQLRQVPIA